MAAVRAARAVLGLHAETCCRREQHRRTATPEPTDHRPASSVPAGSGGSVDPSSQRVALGLSIRCGAQPDRGVRRSPSRYQTRSDLLSTRGDNPDATDPGNHPRGDVRTLVRAAVRWSWSTFVRSTRSPPTRGSRTAGRRHCRAGARRRATTQPGTTRCAGAIPRERSTTSCVHPIHRLPAFRIEGSPPERSRVRPDPDALVRPLPYPPSIG